MLGAKTTVLAYRRNPLWKRDAFAAATQAQFLALGVRGVSICQRSTAEEIEITCSRA
jgi:hypothetical protein